MRGSFTYNTIAFTAIAEYAITVTANLLAFEQGYPCELVIGSPRGRAFGGIVYTVTYGPGTV